MPSWSAMATSLSSPRIRADLSCGPPVVPPCAKASTPRSRFQRETEEGPDQHDEPKQADCLQREGGGDHADDVCSDQELKPRQNAAPEVGASVRVGVAPVATASPPDQKDERHEPHHDDNDARSEQLKNYRKRLDEVVCPTQHPSRALEWAPSGVGSRISILAMAEGINWPASDAGGQAHRRRSARA